jgi:hypothetical protein
MFRPLMLAIIRLFNMKYLSISYTSIWIVRGWRGCERVRSHIMGAGGAWTGVCAVGNTTGMTHLKKPAYKNTVRGDLLLLDKHTFLT